MDDEKGLSWVDSERRVPSLEAQMPEKAIKKRSFQEAKKLMESNEDEELKQQAKRAKVSHLQVKEKKSLSKEHVNDVQSGSEEEYQNVDQMNKRRFDESESDSSSDSSSSEDEDNSI
mmetsp:Transcript_10044/g.7544  ORF Transcript_10044/g.7544 Transcript_10044/m.7544 type:complete len:117 (+) Transcript_10044:571-921(+)